MTIEDAERIVKEKYPGAFPFFFGSLGAWSICDGTRTRQGNIRIVGVGLHSTIESAWRRAAEIVQEMEEKL